jgi:hypothetical protein
MRSIYFFDPNGIRLELAVKAVQEEKLNRLGSDAHEKLNRQPLDPSNLSSNHCTPERSQYKLSEFKCESLAQVMRDRLSTAAL